MRAGQPQFGAKYFLWGNQAQVQEASEMITQQNERNGIPTATYTNWTSSDYSKKRAGVHQEGRVFITGEEDVAEFKARHGEYKRWAAECAEAREAHLTGKPVRIPEPPHQWVEYHRTLPTTSPGLKASRDTLQIHSRIIDDIAGGNFDTVNGPAGRTGYKAD